MSHTYSFFILQYYYLIYYERLFNFYFQTMFHMLNFQGLDLVGTRTFLLVKQY